MFEYLVFQLYGPFVSWGDIAVGEMRPSAMMPAKSAILGLLAAAMGIRRPNTARNAEERQSWESQHKKLAEGYGVATRTDMPGAPLTDYHTTESPKGKGFSTRYDEVQEIRRQKKEENFKGTILSRREYRQDSFYAVAVWVREDAPFELTVLKNGLINPEFVLYLGRKACALSLPLNPKVLSKDTIEEALASIPFPPEPRSLFHRLEGAYLLYSWDDDAVTRLSKERTISRRDGVLSRDRWQFSVRQEHQAYVLKGENP
jgi:CRISPR system Cascade subunit CasD